MVVPCRNEIKHIEICLRSLQQQEKPEGGFEVIVADGMSDDGTRELLKRMVDADARFRVVDNPSRIAPSGMNCGIRAARGEWVAIMGCHNQYAPDYLVRCLEAAQASGADNVGGAMFSQGEGLIQRAIAAAHHSPFSVGGARWHNPDYRGPADTVFGGFYKRETFERIGLFDEELVRNQDDELNLRLTRAGGTIWQSSRIRSWYHPRNSLSSLFCQYKQYGYWKVRVVQKHKLPASLRHLVPGGFLLALAVFGFVSVLCALASQLWSVSPKVGRISAVALSVLILSYSVAVLAASALTARKNDWSLLPVLPVVFACYHFGYGYGFLRGIWDFVIRKKRPGQQFVQLTRAASPARKSSGG